MSELAGAGGTTIIAPVDFHGHARPPERKRSIGRWITRLALILVIGALAVAGLFVLTASQVTITIEPEPESLDLDGPALRLRLGEHLLLRHGIYTLNASLEGYHPLDAEFTVARGQDNEYHFELAELPGILELRAVGADAPAVALSDVRVEVDGRPVGRTPIGEVELERGGHAVRVDHERYQTLDVDVDVEGFGRRQSVTLEMRPDWAAVDVATTPAGAEVWLDGAKVAETPCAFDVLSGEHLLAIKASLFETWERELVVIAEQPVDLTGIVLDPAKGRVVVETDPAGAQVMVDGAYAGASPVEAEAPPNRDVLVQVAHDGYEPAEQTVHLGPEEVANLEFELIRQYGTVRLDVDPPDATLHVDGAPWGSAPTQITLPAVEHRLEFSKNGYTTVVRTVRPRPDVPERITVRLGQPEAPPVEPEARPTAGNGYPFVRLEPAIFTMGASRREQGRRSNETLRNVQLQRPVLMGAREVTNEEYRAFKPGHQSGFVDTVSLSGGDRPVVQVTWEDAARYCNWLSEKDGLPPAYEEFGGVMIPLEPMTIGYRLPTEAEWEYAARVVGSGTPLKYAWGGSFPPRKKSGNYADESASDIINLRIDGYTDGHAGSAPVGTFEANHIGLFDMGGNVAEWCHDFYVIYTYDPEKIAVDPMGPEEGQHHVVRGASWRHASMSILRLSYRDYSDDKRDDLGFRICRYAGAAEISE